MVRPKRNLAEVRITLPESLAIPAHEMREYWFYLQCMANRRGQGFVRYGPNTKKQKYLDRLKMEVAAYERTGNIEHLYNISNYGYLESAAPQNPKFHWDDTVESVTRKKKAVSEVALVRGLP